jgi:hypothetical protein
MNTQEAIDILNTLLDKNRFTDGVEISALIHAIEHMKRGAPEGWQLVPKEPTRDMLFAPNTIIQTYGAGLIYSRMLSAAPEPPQERKD